MQNPSSYSEESMAKFKEENEDDSEESLISQFETTLSIRPSNDIPEDEDLSIDHTTVIHGTTIGLYNRDQSIVDIEELEEEEQLLEQIPNFKAKRQYRLQPENAIKTTKINRADKGRFQKADTSEYLSLQNAAFRKTLEPSPYLDIELLRFNRTFEEFIAANPQIMSESPKFRVNTDKTLVLLSPYSPEHAFGRKWVSKSYLATIFERPQRLLAASIGVSAALTMFPYFYEVANSTKKGSLFSDHVLKVHGRDWPRKLFELCIQSHEKLNEGKLEVPEDWNVGDIYLTPKTITALEGVLGTIETSIDSLYASKNEEDNHKLAFVVLRPPGHHSHACLPSGFCLLNNAQIGIEYAYDKYGVTHCAVLDIDLHHGDGSQDICWERAGFRGDYGKKDDEFFDAKENPRNDYGKKFSLFPKVGYFSLHDIKSYPTELGYATKENIKNASLCIMDHDLNLWNVHLQDWSTEEEFYKHYRTKYVAILNRANQFLNLAKKQYEQTYASYLTELSKYNKYLLKPHLYKQDMSKPIPPPPFKPLIVISAGFDASEYENPQMQRHGINVPTSFYATFTKDVVKLAKIHTEGKVVSFLEGGYSDGALISGIFSHLIGFTNNQKYDDENDDLLWNDTWGTEQVIKELSKGCKRSWAAYKNPKSDITIWANEVIKLGRAMMPNSILPTNYIYQYNDLGNKVAFERSVSPDAVAGNKMLREILDEEGNPHEFSKSPVRNDPEDNRRIIRHTRSYYKKKG